MHSSLNLAFGTPTLTALSNRGSQVRTLTYNRQVANAELDERIERIVHSPAGFVASRIDARLFSAGGTPNFSYVTSLTGRVLRVDSADAGVTVTLVDVDGRPAWTHDGRGTVATWIYDPLGRPLAAQEATGIAAFKTRDRWKYGEGELNAQVHNLRGQCVRHYDTAGRLASSGFTLNGQPLDQTRRLLADPEAMPNWNGDDEAAWVTALGVTAYPTTWTYDAAEAWLTQTDAKGNVQVRAFDVAGRLANSRLKLASGSWQPVLSAIDYSAAGQVLSETASNGVIARCEYEPQTQRLIRLSATRPAQASHSPVLQDLRYQYDPVGNLLNVYDDAQPTTYWRNQKIEPAHIYTYDALYQLISATGREMINRGRQGAELPKPLIPLPNDDSVYTNYTRAYTYDRGGNLTRIQHRGAVNYTQEIVVSDRSNHALQQNATGTITPAGVDDGSWFDASGNQRMLLPDRLQPLNWNDRNRLSGVTLVPRPSQPDRETYQYGADGMRVRKHATLRTSGTIRTSEVIYLPGLTLRITTNDDGRAEKVVAVLQEVKVDASRLSARTLHWEAGQPSGIANDTTRYGIGDLINSIGLELDEQANLISREEYYPYGGTAVWTACSQVEADTKYVRYSGKERDATGLYDYGWRAYQPWIGRWLNPDPAGTVDGLNLYRMVMNNPSKFVDATGLAPTNPKEELYNKYKAAHVERTAYDRTLPFEIMDDVTGKAIIFEQNMADEKILDSTKDKKFTIRHYTKLQPGQKPFDEIASNFDLHHKNPELFKSKKSGSNTNKDDWIRLGNSSFTFFLLSINEEVSQRNFLSNTTHYAEIDIENPDELKSLGLENADFFASPDLINEKDLSKVPAVKGKLSDLKSILLEKTKLKPIAVKTMTAKVILNEIDAKFKNKLEIKIPGNVKANRWFEK
ncbi:hypothetical protein WS67_08420 [Burkholderia singularis]|uniref:Insecticidal toxin complex n=1 Tax=Burkholderia singularis TaxID=1503053 RepID=A0A103E5G8_9BURK|nr:RHS repeat-associated core domain-containing protein [Burkholderia singularis]KVE28727.1 hypothetical protein WS67_08420 [Burkholderia singularis]